MHSETGSKKREKVCSRENMNHRVLQEQYLSEIGMFFLTNDLKEKYFKYLLDSGGLHRQISIAEALLRALAHRKPANGVRGRQVQGNCIWRKSKLLLEKKGSKLCVVTGPWGGGGVTANSLQTHWPCMLSLSPRPTHHPEPRDNTVPPSLKPNGVCSQNSQHSQWLDFKSDLTAANSSDKGS